MSRKKMGKKEKKKVVELKRFLLYELRWQASSPILAICLVWLGGLGTFWATVIANLIGGAIFFWIDKLIFKDEKK